MKSPNSDKCKKKLPSSALVSAGAYLHCVAIIRNDGIASNHTDEEHLYEHVEKALLSDATPISGVKTLAGATVRTVLTIMRHALCEAICQLGKVWPVRLLKGNDVVTADKNVHLLVLGLTLSLCILGPLKPASNQRAH